MRNGTMRIDLVKLAKFLLKYIWLIVLCAAIGFGVMYQRAAQTPNRYTSSGTMYVVNANPNQINYGYVNMTDLTSAVQLIETYSVVVRSERVMGAVLEYPVDEKGPDGMPTGKTILLVQKYPGLTSGMISAAISMSSVNETPMVRVSCTTEAPEKSMDICNAVLAIAPGEIVNVVGAGQAQMVDAASLPMWPNPRGERQKGIIGAAIGAAAAAALLILICLIRQRITDVNELTDRYTPPVLSGIKRDPHPTKDPSSLLLSKSSRMETLESYAKLRINLLYALVEKRNNVVEVTSAISGEGKSTIASNLGVSCAVSGKRTLIVDADMRRGCQRDIFRYAQDLPGLSDVLAGTCKWQDAIVTTDYAMLSLLPAGRLPSNPSELLETGAMKALLKELSEAFDIVLLDVPPINIVADPLTLSQEVAGSIFVVRQGYSSHREVRKALISAEMTGMVVLGFVFYGKNVSDGGAFSRRYYRDYYHRYDTRNAAQLPIGPAGGADTESASAEAAVSGSGDAGTPPEHG